MKSLVFTICSNNYLAQAINLGRSLLEFNPDYLFKIGLVDSKTDSIDYGQLPFEAVELDKIGISGLDAMVLRYDITELNTAVKPYFFNYFRQQYPGYGLMIYMDPDIQVYHSFELIEKEIQSNNILLTPHFTTPINDGKLLSEEDILNTGIYNLGFIAIKNNPVGEELISWWSDRLQYKAYIDFQKGMFTDQIWANLIPLFFEGVGIIYHRGHNMAYWNLHERELVQGPDAYMVNGEERLVFFHFSGYNPLKKEVLSKYQNRYAFKDRPDIEALFADYASRLIDNGFKEYITFPCSYVERKREYDLKQALEARNSIPRYKRFAMSILRWFIRKLELPMR